MILHKLKRKRFVLTKEGGIVRGVLLAVGHLIVLRLWLVWLWHIPWKDTGNNPSAVMGSLGTVVVLILGGFMIYRFYVRAFRYFTKAPSDCKRLYWNESRNCWVCRSYSSGKDKCTEYQQCPCYVKSRKLNYKY